MAKKSAAGTGTIRKKTVERGGKKYTYWEARYTAGRDPGTGKQIQRSITGRTQKEVSQRLRETVAALDAGTYQAPNKITVEEWLDIWLSEFLRNVKPLTVKSYKAAVENHIKPAMGATRLEALPPQLIQSLYNRLSDEEHLSPKTIKNIHGTLHRALQQAVAVGYLRSNPADSCVLPKTTKPEIMPLDDSQITTFLKATEGHRFADLYAVTLFTGMRKGEILGLTWANVDFKHSTIAITQQLQNLPGKGYQLVTTKNGKGRTITVAPTIMARLRKVHARQIEWRLKAGEYWENSGLVFTDELGRHLVPYTVSRNFKEIVEKIGIPGARFHDLRHSFAVASLRSGDDIKTVQQNLGHATAAFTLDVYAHVTEQMKQESASRMEQFIKGVSGL